MEMQGKVAIVTGGSGAIGTAVVRSLLDEGATVVVAGRSALARVEDRLSFVETDVTNEESVHSLVERVAAVQGTVHALFNVAGGFKYGPAVDELAMADWDSLLDLNLKSAFLCMKHVLPVMKEQRYGRIVSVAARSGLKGDAMVAPYAVSKGGVILLTQTVAEESKAYGVTANAVLPSIVDTPANRASMPDADFSAWVAPADLAEVMVFLASDRARAVTGAAVPVYNRA
jgi:NAD(P)-dependent dehydrogenase (short-subunit alcohol dehydrogenase family)